MLLLLFIYCYYYYLLLQEHYYYFKDGEFGDENRLFMSRKGSLYRMKEFVVNWNVNVQDGNNNDNINNNNNNIFRLLSLYDLLLTLLLLF